MSDPRLLPAASSSAFLPADGSLRRLVRVARRPRPAAFFDRFETLALVYDAFWHADGVRILLVGPAPFNLMPTLRGARFTALPSRAVLRPRFYPTLSVMVTELIGAPTDTSEFVMTIDGRDHVLPIRPNLSNALAGRRILFSMNKDNDLAWIAEWAGFHARRHGTDTVILFDNASTRYGVPDIEAALLAVPGVRHVAAPSWPWAFGAHDPAVTANPFWAHFLQNASMSVVLRRYGAKAFGLLNCDIDELAVTHSGVSIHDLAARSRAGLISFSGQWVEGVAEPRGGDGPPTHRDYLSQSTDPDKRTSSPRKWSLDPTRAWISRLKVQPYWHWIANRPPFSKVTPDDAYYLHFKGINTHWKIDRSLSADTDSANVRRNPALAGLFKP